MAQQKPLVVGAAGIPARIQSGDTLDPAVLGTGTRDGTRFLRDDGSYVALSPQSSAMVGFSSYRSAERTTNGIFTGYSAIDTGAAINTGAFNASTGVFTAPVSGLYLFSCIAKKTTNTTGRSIFAYYVNGGLHEEWAELYSGYQDVGAPISVYLSAGHTFSIGTVGMEASASLCVIMSGFLVGAGTSESTPAAFRAKVATTQTIADWNWVKVQAATELFDTSAAYSNSLYRFTPNVPGYYLLLGVIEVSNTAASSAVGAAIYFNGAWSLGGTDQVYTSGSVWRHAAVQELRYFNGTTDYAELWANTSPNAVIASGSQFSGFLVSGGGTAAWGDIIGTLSDQTDLQNALNAKQATLVSGTNIKTINGTSILGGGNLVVGGGGSASCTFNISGAFTVPFVGTSRRYFSASQSFTKATIGVAGAPTSILTATIKKNGVSVGTITIAANEHYNTNVQSISIAAGDYLTVDVSGADASNLVLTLE